MSIKFQAISTESHLENDGIGAYECHGYKGFDHGSTWLDIYIEINVDTKTIPETEIEYEENQDFYDDMVLTELEGYEEPELQEKVFGNGLITFYYMASPPISEEPDYDFDDIRSY